MRGTWVFRDGKAVPKHEAMLADYRQVAHLESDLPRPAVHGVIQEYRSMANGEVITDRRRHREHLKETGYVEVGSEGKSMSKQAPTAAELKAVKEERKRDIRDSLEQIKAGVAPPVAVDENGKAVEAPEMEPIVVAGVPENGAYVRADDRPGDGVTV